MERRRSARVAASRRAHVLACAFLALAATAARAAGPAPVYVGLDLELSHRSSSSAQAIRRGVLIAIDEINARGGVLGGRPLRVVERDNHSVPARGVENLRELAAIPDLVAVFCGKFGPVAMEQVPVAHELRVILLDPWASNDGIVENGFTPNFAFRISLADRWAMPALLEHAAGRGHARVGLLLANTSWGRSNDASARAYLAAHPGTIAVATRWHNIGDTSLVEHVRQFRRAGATAVVAAIIDPEGSILIREVAALPPEERLPIISHHGIVGQDLAAAVGEALRQVDLTVMQAFSFGAARGPRAARVIDAARRLFGVSGLEELPSPAGLATAYDLTHLLARAIERAGSTDRSRIRDALERIPRHEGLVKTYAPPFTRRRHDALDRRDAVFTRFDERGVLVPVPARRP